MRKELIRIVYLTLILLNLLSAQGVVINELMPANSSTIADEDQDYPDWIELYNRDTQAVNLNGYSLSDDPEQPFRWIFHTAILQPDEYLLIFASGKDRRIQISHWETIIDWGDEWRYRVGISESPANWNTLSFNDSYWLKGPSGFGYGDNDDNSIIPTNRMSVFARKKFIIADPASVSTALLHVDYDDAFVAYLNGTEIARANVGQPGIPVRFDQPASTAREAQIYLGGKPELFIVDSIQSLILSGENVLAIQVQNTDVNSSDLTLIPFFTLGLTGVPPDTGGVPEILQPVSSLLNLHTNFSIKASGENLILRDSTGTLVDQISTGPISADVSYGRKPDGSVAWFYFDKATPGSGNTTAAFLALAEEPQFSHSGGIYTGDFNLELSVSSPLQKIYYTLDGTEPTTSSFLYQDPIAVHHIPASADAFPVVRAKTYAENMLPSRTITHSYFINPGTGLPIVSLVSDPANFFDNDSGIYVMGDDAVANFPYWGANFWNKCPQDQSTSIAYCENEPWERPVRVEFFESGGYDGFSIDAGVRIVGHWARGLPQKSLAIFARGKYGDPEINYQIFPDLPVASFQAFVLRNSGQDWTRTMFRDAYHHRAVRELDLDKIAYRPAVVFINGVYWGIHEVREKVNEDYLASHHHIDPERIDLLEDKFGIQVIAGDQADYLELIGFLETHDLSNPDYYAMFKNMVEVDELIDYTITQCFFIVWDWPGGNVKYWRPELPGGRWRWILTDTDYGSNFLGYPPGTGWTPASTNFFTERLNGWIFFSKPVTNPEYKYNFINRFADRLNTIFTVEQLTGLIDQLKSDISAEMPNHINRWKNWEYTDYTNWLGHSINSMEEWDANIGVVREFAQQRPAYVTQHIMTQFNLSGTERINLHVSDPGHGKIQISSLSPEQYPWSGTYFTNVPIPIRALPAAGYRFIRWEGDIVDDQDSITINPSRDLSITAVFESADTDSGNIVINEINYHPAPDFNTDDWVELYNASHGGKDLSGWMFRDADETHQYLFPAQTQMEPGSYLVLCRNSQNFSTFFPEVQNYLGDFEFGLSGDGESLFLLDSYGTVIDSLSYDDALPWPVEADGSGPTLALINPLGDNSDAHNWYSEYPHGSPGRGNYITALMTDGPMVRDNIFLAQNIPNPFNGQTLIHYSNRESGPVRIGIYNLLGQLIYSEYHEHQHAGWHSVVFDAGNLSSGIYFCLLQSGSVKQYKKMILLR